MLGMSQGIKKLLAQNGLFPVHIKIRNEEKLSASLKKQAGPDIRA